MYEAVHLARELGQPFSLGHALMLATLFHLARGDGRIAQERAEALVAFGERGLCPRIPVTGGE